jgi:hypothetical protein
MIPTVKDVEDRVGMGHGAWDIVDPVELIEEICALSESNEPHVHLWELEPPGVSTTVWALYKTGNWFVATTCRKGCCVEGPGGDMMELPHFWMPFAKDAVLPVITVSKICDADRYRALKQLSVKECLHMIVQGNETWDAILDKHIGK